MMSNERKETLSVRLISVGFTVLALAVFKPFGLQAWHWETYVHLLVIFAMGLAVCMLTEGILKYVVKMPRSLEHGVDYIIRRNLWFQLINTPLITVMICLYRHLVLSDRVPGNALSVGNLLETLLIIAFCSFAIGLYWRFKFRSRYLSAELEETAGWGERLQGRHQQQALAAAAPMGETAGQEHPRANAATAPTVITLTGSTSETVTLRVAHLLYIEAVGNYVKVHGWDGSQVQHEMLRATTKQIHEQLSPYPMVVRCHRAFLVNLAQVERIVTRAGAMQLVIRHCQDSLPVSRSNMAQVKQAINAMD